LRSIFYINRNSYVCPPSAVQIAPSSPSGTIAGIVATPVDKHNNAWVDAAGVWDEPLHGYTQVTCNDGVRTVRWRQSVMFCCSLKCLHIKPPPITLY